VICRHRIEVGIHPATAEVCFLDERHADPVNTQVRFTATVYNSPSGDVIWTVTDISGNPGAGSIDPTGLYLAPPKGGIPHGHTDIVTATSVDDPMRKAQARVVLIGRGPEPTPAAKLEIYPKTVYLYYQAGHHNSYIDPSNKMQQFRHIIRNTDLTEVVWSITGSGSIGSGTGLYAAPNSGSNGSVATVSAHLKNDTSVKDEAKVILINYDWPGITS
jgi:hypothetical protein